MLIRAKLRERQDLSAHGGKRSFYLKVASTEDERRYKNSTYAIYVRPERCIQTVTWIHCEAKRQSRPRTPLARPNQSALPYQIGPPAMKLAQRDVCSIPKLLDLPQVNRRLQTDPTNKTRREELLGQPTSDACQLGKDEHRPNVQRCPQDECQRESRRRFAAGHDIKVDIEATLSVRK